MSHAQNIIQYLARHDATAEQLHKEFHSLGTAPLKQLLTSLRFDGFITNTFAEEPVGSDQMVTTYALKPAGRFLAMVLATQDAINQCRHTAATPIAQVAADRATDAVAKVIGALERREYI